MIHPIFIDANLQKQFDTEGFVKLKLLEDSDLSELKKLFNTYFPNPSQNFYSSSYENNFPLKKEISDAIGKIILLRLESHFQNYTWFGSAFLSKGNGSRSEMPMHQDWTIVDEKKFVALNIWTPLQNTIEENGTLEVLPGSHKWHDSLRAPTLPFFYEGYQAQLKEKLVPIPTLATEAIVLNQAIIHYSKPNKTDAVRIAITTGIKTKDAPAIFHYWNKNEPDVIEKFSQKDDFLLQFNDFHKDIFNRPQIGESLGKTAFSIRKVSAEEIDMATKPRKESFVNRLKKLFQN